MRTKLSVFGRKTNLKNRSTVVFDFYCSLVQRDYLPCKGKTYSGATLSGAEKAVEDMR